VSRWRRLWQRERLLDAELRDHVERLVVDYVRDGATEEEARRRARLEFGGIDAVKDQCRDVRRTRLVDGLAQDLRYGARVLRRTPGLTVFAIASLALGIGANSAIFSLVDHVLLQSLPVRDPGRLVLLDGGAWTNPVWEQIRDRQETFSVGALAWADARFDLSQGGQTELVEGVWASGGFFDVLGVGAGLGRTFTAGDDRRGGGPDGPVAVISHAFWQRRFGGDPRAIGGSIPINGVPFTIVGITPPSFLGLTPGRSFDVAVPLATEGLVSGRRSWLDARDASMLEIMARLGPGQTVDEATQSLRQAQAQIRAATLPHGWPARMLDRYLSGPMTLVPAPGGPTSFRTRYERPLWILMAVVTLVLLIACANVAHLLLARAAGRQRELTLRLARESPGSYWWKVRCWPAWARCSACASRSGPPA
jgi:predicted permease